MCLKPIQEHTSIISQKKLGKCILEAAITCYSGNPTFRTKSLSSFLLLVTFLPDLNLNIEDNKQNHTLHIGKDNL